MAQPVLAPRDKDMRKVIDAATDRGWTLEQGTGKHHFLRNGHHRMPMSTSPSDAHAHKSLERAIAKCERGDCVHGGAPARVVQRDRSTRLAEDRQRNERRARELELRAKTTTHVPIVPQPQLEPRRPKVAATATRRTRRKPKLEAATKWLTWYLAQREWAKVGDMYEEAERAGHLRPTVQKALKDMPVERQHRGPKLPQLIRLVEVKSVRDSQQSNPAEATTPATPALSVDTRTMAQESGQDSTSPLDRTHRRAVDREWARLEGMADVLGNDALIAQVSKLRALIEEGSA